MDVLKEYPCSNISGKKSMNTVLRIIPTEVLNRKSSVLFEIFFLINKGIAANKQIRDTIITLIKAYSKTMC